MCGTMGFEAQVQALAKKLRNLQRHSELLRDGEEMQRWSFASMIVFYVAKFR
jgi:hypothetical protein